MPFLKKDSTEENDDDDLYEHADDVEKLKILEN